MRASLERVDPVGIAGRWSQHQCVHRRVCTVPYPNTLWHIDSNLKFSRWRFVVHSASLIAYLHCSLSNEAQTVWHIIEISNKLEKRLHKHIVTDGVSIHKECKCEWHIQERESEPFLFLLPAIYPGTTDRMLLSPLS